MPQTDLPVIEQFPAARRVLRITVVTETYPPEVNGVATTIVRFVRGLCDRGHEVQLVRPRQDDFDQAQTTERFHEILHRGVSIPRYPELRMGLPARRALARLWSTARPDVVHLVTEGPLGWSALQAATRLKVPVTSDFRTNFHSYSRHYGVGWLKTPISAYLRKFHNRTAMTMVPTEALQRELAQRGYRNLRVVARGVDTALFDPARRSAELRRQWGADDATPVVEYVGRIAPEKNLDALVEAFEAIRGRTPRARFVVVGDGPAAGALCDRFPDARFAGLRTGEDLARHYASADVFLFPSMTDTFGNVTLEAMSSGLAVVAFDYAAAAAHLAGTGAGVLAPYGDTGAFVRAACDLVADPAHVAACRERSRAAALALEWERIVERFESLLMSVVGTDPRRPADERLIAASV